MRSTVESLEGNKVKLHIVVPSDEFEQAIDAAFRKLAREVRLPGFRPGKAPRQLLQARFGSEIAREQAIRDSLPQYYIDAVTEHDVDVIAMPDIQITAGQDEGDVEFDAVVEVRPQVELAGYDSLRVEVPYRAITDDDVAAQIEALRDRFADLEDSEYPLINDSYASIDITGSVNGEAVDALTANDFLYRVGSGMVVPELDEQLLGTRPGAILEFDATLPERFDERAGEHATFRVIVKEAKQKVLPPLNDEWVTEASEFDTVAELEADIRKRLDLMQKLQAQVALRDKIAQAAAGLVEIEAPDPLVDTETRRLLEDLAHRLSHQGLTLEQYLQATGQDPQNFVDQVREGAKRSVLTDLAFRAVVAHEQLDATDEEVDATIENMAQNLGQKPERVRRDLVRGGGIQAVRSEVARGKAVNFLVEHVTVVDEEGNEVSLDLPDDTEATEAEVNEVNVHGDDVHEPTDDAGEERSQP
jgi:trigger factor